MPNPKFIYSIDEPQKNVTLEFHGELTAEDLIQGVDTLFKDPQTDHADKTVVDLRKTTLNLSSEEMKIVGKHVRDKVEEEPHTTNIAIIVGSTVQYGLSRVFETFAGENGNARVFKTAKEALNWIGVENPPDPYNDSETIMEDLKFRIKADRNNGIIILFRFGENDAQDIKTGQKTAFKWAESEKMERLLCDARMAKINMTLEDIRSQAKETRNMMEENPHVKMAVVEKAEMGVAMVKLYASLIQNNRINTFIDEQAAIHWLTTT